MGRRTILTITTPLHRCLRRSDRQDRWRGARAMGSIRSEPAKPPAIWGMSEEAVGCDAEAGMMMEAAPAAAFVVAETDLLLEFLVIPLDHPPCLGSMDKIAQRGARRQVGQPVLGGFLGAFGPLDQQPLLRPGLRTQGVAVRRAHSQGGEARAELGLAALAPGHPAPSLAGQAES